MKIWKLIAGILSIILSVFIGIQSMAAGAVNALEENGGNSGTVGLICGIMILAGGIVSIATRKAKSVWANLSLIVLFGLAGGIGLVGHGNYKDLVIWSIWALLNAAIALLACFISLGRKSIVKESDSSMKEKTDEKTNRMYLNEVTANECQNPKNFEIAMDISVENLLKRAFMFLEDKDWFNAGRYCERVLDLEPENAKAHLGKLMAEVMASSLEELPERDVNLEENKSFQRVVRFGDEELKALLAECEKKARDKGKQRKEDAYNETLDRLKTAKTMQEFLSLAEIFSSMSGYKDAEERAAECEGQAKLVLSKKRRKKRIVTGLCVVALLTGMVIACVVIKKKVEEIHNQETIEQAMKLLEEENYSDAYKILEKMGKTELMGDKMEVAMKCFSAGNDTVGHSLLGKLLEETKVGDKILFGEYELNGNFEDGKERIEWTVLDKDETGIKVISSEILDQQPFDTARYGNNVSYTWKDSNIRVWLNYSFVSAFSVSERTIIDQIIQHQSDYDTQEDWFSLLSEGEAMSYFGTRESRECYKAKPVSGEKKTGDWLLRDPGVFIDLKGNVYRSTYVYRSYGVRPVMWLKLK